MSSQNIDQFDLAKFCLILMVLAIHAPLYTGVSICGVDVISPFLRMAVPLFFMISAYLFWGKCKGLGSDVQRNASLRHFVSRNLALYGFWFVVLLPVTIYVKWDWWCGQGLIKGTCIFLLNFLFGGTFLASWFIMALVEAVVLVAWLSRKMCTKAIICLGAVAYLFCAFCSSYADPLLCMTFPDVAGNIFVRAIIEHSPTSFLSAIVWIAIGKAVVESAPKARHVYVFLGGAVLYFVEIILVCLLSGGKERNECYFMMVPACVFAFIALCKVKLHIHHAKSFREISTVLYVLHHSAFVVIGYVFDNTGVCDKHHLIKYLAGIAICLLIWRIISKLSRINGFKWLSCAY